MMPSLFSPSLLPLLLILVSTKAAKDNDYYYPGFVNPNTDYHMYWKDSINVLEDLDQFESLYIKYHHCVWSKYGTRYGTGEDYDEQDGNDNDGAFANGCDGFGGGEAYWYMGRSQCFKANVAYSLYGVLKGDDPKKKRGSYCHGDSYINSFFTTFGVESFAGPMGMGTNQANSVCVRDGGNGNDDENGDQNGDYSYAQVDDDYLSDDYVFYDSSSYTSQGVGCSASGSFVRDLYNGPFCHGQDYASTMDGLEDFNSALKQMDCQEVYSASGGNNNNNDDEGRKLAKKQDRALNEDGGYEFDYEFDYMSAYKILSFSKSCSVAQYPNDCPDPYGKKRKYAHNIQRALAYKTGRYRDLGTTIVKALSWVFFAAAFCLVGGIIWMTQSSRPTEHKEEGAKPMTVQGFLKKSKKKTLHGFLSKSKKKNKNKLDDDDTVTLERGFESTLSKVKEESLCDDDNHSKSSKNSKRSKGSSSKGSKSSGSFLGKLKLPKKLRKKQVEDIADDESVEFSVAEYQEYKESSLDDYHETKVESGFINMENIMNQAASLVGMDVVEEGTATESSKVKSETENAEEGGDGHGKVAAGAVLAGAATVSLAAANTNRSSSKSAGRTRLSLRAILPGSKKNKDKISLEEVEDRIDRILGPEEQQGERFVPPGPDTTDGSSLPSLPSEMPRPMGERILLWSAPSKGVSAESVELAPQVVSSDEYGEVFSEEEDGDEEAKDGEQEGADTKSKKKRGRFFRRSSKSKSEKRAKSPSEKRAKSPSRAKSPLRDLFSKSAKSLSPSQMATVSVLSAGVVASAMPKESSTKSPPSSSKSLLSISSFFKKGEDHQVVEDTAAYDDLVKPSESDDKPVGTEAEYKSSGKTKINLARMIDIIEPAKPPESQKDLIEVSPPVSQRGFSVSGSTTSEKSHSS